MATRKLEVVITGDAKSLERAFGKSGRETQSFGKKLAGFGKVAAQGFGVAGIAAAGFAAKAIQMASDAEEVRSKLNVVFGKETPKLVKNLDAFSKATGTSRFELREQAADLGALLKPMLGSTQGAAQMSTSIVKLATDLGSFNNIPTGDALEKIRAGLVGEAEPLRSLGVLINDTTVKQKAYTMGLAAQGAELTEQQKVQARYALIMEQTKLAQGDAERTSGSFANQLKRLKSNISDTATELGIKLLPVVNKVLTWANENWPAFQRAVTNGARDVRQAIDAMSGVFSAMVAVARPALNTLKAVVQTVLAIISGDWSKAWEGLKGIVTNALKTALAIVRTYLSSYKAIGRALGNAIWEGIKAGLAALAGLGQNLLARVLRQVASVAEGAHSIATSVGKAIVNGVVEGIKSLPNAIGDALADVAGAGWGIVKRAIGSNSPSKVAAREVGQPIIEGVAKGILERAGQVHKALTGAVVDAIREAKGNAGSLAAGLASSIGAGIDARTAGRLAAVDTGPEATRLRAIEAAQRASQTAREKTRLQAAIDTAEDADARREAQQALDDWLLDQEAQTLQASLDQQRTTIQQQEDDRKSALERGLADLTDTFNRGGIKAKEFNQQLQDMLAAAGVDYTNLGQTLGSSFANAFRDQLQALQQQIREIATGPQAGRVTGAEPDVVSPFATQFGEWDERRRQLVKNLAEARKRSTAAGGAGGKDVTAAERKRITDAEAALKSQLAARPTRDGITVVQNFNVPATDANALMAAASWQLRTAVA